MLPIVGQIFVGVRHELHVLRSSAICFLHASGGFMTWVLRTGTSRGRPSIAMDSNAV